MNDPDPLLHRDLLVPPGATATATGVRAAFHDNGRNHPGDLDGRVGQALARVGGLCFR